MIRQERKEGWKDGRKQEEGEEVRKGRGPEIVLFSGREEVGRKIQHGDLSPPCHGGDR